MWAGVSGKAQLTRSTVKALPLWHRGVMSDWADSLAADTALKHLSHTRTSTFPGTAVNPAGCWRSPGPEGEAWERIKEGFVQTHRPASEWSACSAGLLWNWEYSHSCLKNAWYYLTQIAQSENGTDYAGYSVFLPLSLLKRTACSHEWAAS